MEIGSLFVKLALDAKKYAEDLAKQARETSKFAAGLQSGLSGAADVAKKTLLGLGAAATITGAAIGAFAIDGINKMADLDHQIGGIAATMGKTKNEVEPLKKLIFDLSLNPNLTVNATQAAEAIEMLARNGLTMEQILGGAAESTVALANATGAEFGTAADVATDVMALFNIEAGNMGQAIDGITGVTTSSKFTIDDYALALAQAGGVAAGYGVSLEDLNTVIAATSSAFASGGDAGTSYKTLLQRLANPTKEVQQLMDQYGVSLFDSEGKMRSMGDVAGDLNKIFYGTIEVTDMVGGATDEMIKMAEKATSAIPELTQDIQFQQRQLGILQQELNTTAAKYGVGSTQAQKKQLAIDKLTASIIEDQQNLQKYETSIAAVNGAQAQAVTTTKQLNEAERAELAAKLGGADAARTVLELAKLTNEEYDALNEKVNAQGQAFKSAATRVDSFKGAMEIAKGVVEAVQLQIGDKFLPLLRGLTGGFTDLAAQAGPQVVDFFGRVAEKIDYFIGRGQALASVFQIGGVGGLAIALGLTPEVVELIDKVSASVGSVATTISGLLMPALGEMSGSGVLDLINQGIEWANQNFELLTGAVAGLGVVLAGGVLVALVAGIASLVTPFTALIAVAATLGAAWAGNWYNIQGVTTAFINIFMTSVVAPLQQAFANVNEALNSLGINWTDIFTAVGVATGAVILGVVSAIVGLVSGIANGVSTFTSYLGQMQANSMQVFTGIAQIIVGFKELISGILSGDMQAISNGFSTWVSGIGNVFGGLVNTIITTIKALGGTAWSIISNFVSTTIGTFQSLYDAVVGHSIIPDMVNDVIEWLKKLPGKAMEIGRDLVLGIKQGIDKNVSKVYEVIKSMAKNAIEQALNVFGIHSPSTVFFGIAENIVGGLIAGVSATAPQFHKTLLDAMNVQSRITARGLGQNFSKVAKEFLGRLLGRSGVVEALDQGTLSAARLKEEAYKLADALNYPPSLVATLTNYDSLAGDLIAKFKELQKTLRIQNALGGLQRAGQFLGLGQAALDRWSSELEAVRSQAEAIKEEFGDIEFGGQTRSLIELMQEQDKILKKQLAGQKLNLAETNRWYEIQAAVMAAVGGSRAEYDRIKTAALELNKISAQEVEFQKQQAELARQQADLQFLQQQLNLLKMLDDMGIDAKSIFGGLTFGLDASLPDLVEATRRAVAAIINTVDRDMQIASPSKVMIHRGKQIMAGLQKPLKEMTLKIPALGQLGRADNSRTITNNNNWNLHSSAPTGSLFGESRALGAALGGT